MTSYAYNSSVAHEGPGAGSFGRFPMTTCAHCGNSKPQHTIRCEHCEGLDERVLVLTAHGVSMLALTVLGLIGLSVYRFWTIGWPAWHGNLRFTCMIVFMVAPFHRGRGHISPASLARSSPGTAPQRGFASDAGPLQCHLPHDDLHRRTPDCLTERRRPR